MKDILKNTPPVTKSGQHKRTLLFCAQDIGSGGWGHFMRMVTLKRALTSVSAPPSNHPSIFNVSPRIWLSVVRTEPSKKSSKQSSKQSLKHSKRRYPLTPAEKADFLPFPSTAARTRWILRNKPLLIVWDVRDKGLAVIKQTSSGEHKIIHIVLDSNHIHARAYADYLIRSLPYIHDKKDKTAVPHSAHFKHLKGQSSNDANLLLDWHVLLQSSRTVGLASPPPSQPTKPEDSPIVMKERTRQGRILSIDKASEPYVVVYIGGITKITYWTQLYRQVLALLIHNALTSLREASLRKTSLSETPLSEISRSETSRSETPRSETSRSETSRSDGFLNKNSMLSALPATMILIDQAVEGKRVWMDTSLAEITKYQKHFTAYGRDIAWHKQLSEYVRTHTHFLERATEEHYEILLRRAQYVFTHPSLTAQNALRMGIPLWIAAPTPYLRALGNQDFKPFFQTPAQLLKSSLTSSSPITPAFHRQALIPMKKLIKTIYKETRRAQKRAALQTTKAAKGWTMIELLAKFHSQSPISLERNCPVCRRNQGVSGENAQKHPKHQKGSKDPEKKSHNNRRTAPTSHPFHPNYEIIARYPTFNLLQCLNCKAQFRVKLFNRTPTIER